MIKTYEGFKDWFKKKTEVIEEFYPNGQKKYEGWSLNGKLHREDGPAIQEWYENDQKEFEIWCLNGQYHRENGPAVQWWYDNGQIEYEKWYLNGKQYSRDSREEWIEQLKEIGSPHYEEQKMLYTQEQYNI